MSHPNPSKGPAALFVLLPADGASMGNLTLRTELGWDEERYLAARQPLLDTGIAATGRGRGGSLRRAEPSQVPPPERTVYPSGWCSCAISPPPSLANRQS